MIRNVLLFLAGVVVSVGVLRFWPEGRAFVLGARPAPPGPGSNIRVVGGSITARIGKQNSWSVDTSNRLMVTGVDAWSFALENVAETSNGKMIPMQSYPHMGDRWRIMDLVKDTQGGDHGVEIDIATGGAPAGGSVTFSVINSGDTFVKVGNSNARKYHDQNCPAEPADCKLDKVDRIQVFMGGSANPDPWFCVHPDRHCHVDIGDY
jgi:hypothetical protein